MHEDFCQIQSKVQSEAGNVAEVKEKKIPDQDKLQLFSLELRRLRENLIEVFKILKVFKKMIICFHLLVSLERMSLHITPEVDLKGSLGGTSSRKRQWENVELTARCCKK